MPERRQVLFIFGAGISLASTPPDLEPITTDMITRKVLSKKLSLHRCGKFVEPCESDSVELVENGIHPFLQLIKHKFVKYLGYREKNVTYEDIFFFLNIVDHEYGYAKNPILKKALLEFWDETHCVWTARDHLLDEDYDCFAKTRLSQTYIKDVTQILLAKYKEPRGMNWIVNSLVENEYDLNIATLNHDILLEKTLTNNSIPYCDGFVLNKNACIREFDPRIFTLSNKIRLLKLHGSIDWKGYGGLQNYVVGIPQDGFIEHGFLDFGGPHEDPVILAGTHNKLEAYVYGIYSDLFAEFVRLLWNSMIVICCGYGFGDRGINSRLINWLRLDEGNVMIVIDPHGKDIISGKEFHATQLLRDVRPNHVKFITSRSEDTNWDKVKKQFLC